MKDYNNNLAKKSATIKTQPRAVLLNTFRLKSLSAVLLAIAAMPAFATTITFDDLGSAMAPIPNGYNGLNWDNFWTLDIVYERQYTGPSGYDAAVISPNNVAFNGFGNPALVSDTLVDLNSAYLTAAWNDNLSVTVIGSFLGNTLYDNTYLLSATTPTLINFNYLGVDSVQFISSGGTHHNGYDGGNGTNFAMDNLVINQTTTVPDTGSTAMLLGLSICGFGFLRRKLG